MEAEKPSCETHKYPIQLICFTCKVKMCCKCTGPHFKNGCKGAVVDLASYAEQNLMPQLSETLEKLKSGRQKVEDAAQKFTGVLPEIKKNLHTIKEKAEKLLTEIGKALAALEEYDSDSAGSAYIKMKEELELQLDSLRSAMKNDNMGQIMKVISATQKTMGDCELQLSGATVASVNKVLLNTEEFETMSKHLQGLVTTCQNVFKRKFWTEVTSRFVYGVCNRIGCYNKLCRYNIDTNKVAPCVDVPQCCSVLQTGKRIFISGGFNPLVNTLSEFLDETQSLVGKKPMENAKYYHTAIAFSMTQFMTIGGHDGKASLACCEEYSILDNAWKALPSLNQARQCAAAALSYDGAYLYVIGGADSKNVIERMDMKEKKVWDKVVLFDEVIFVGNNTTDCGTYNTKTGAVKKHSQSLKPDWYHCNKVCMINWNAYIMGSCGHLHIYKTAEKRVEEIDYSAAASA